MSPNGPLRRPQITGKQPGSRGQVSADQHCAPCVGAGQGRRQASTPMAGHSQRCHLPGLPSLSTCSLPPPPAPAGLQLDETLEQMQQGTLLRKVKSKSWKKQRYFRLQDDCMTVWYKSKKTGYTKYTCEYSYGCVPAHWVLSRVQSERCVAVHANPHRCVCANQGVCMVGVQTWVCGGFSAP